MESCWRLWKLRRPRKTAYGLFDSPRDVSASTVRRRQQRWRRPDHANGCVPGLDGTHGPDAFSLCWRPALPPMVGTASAIAAQTRLDLFELDAQSAFAPLRGSCSYCSVYLLPA